MDALGDKLHAKKIAKDAGVNVVPGYIGEISDVEQALKIGLSFHFLFFLHTTSMYNRFVILTPIFLDFVD
jgi:acetyl/propionyl-CoA carboxylase alpha subunit